MVPITSFGHQLTHAAIAKEQELKNEVEATNAELDKQSNQQRDVTGNNATNGFTMVGSPYDTQEGIPDKSAETKANLDGATASAQNLAGEMGHVADEAGKAADATKDMLGGGSAGGGGTPPTPPTPPGGGNPPEPPDDDIKEYIRLIEELEATTNRAASIMAKKQVMPENMIKSDDLQFLEEYNNRLKQAEELRDKIISFGNKADRDSVSSMWEGFQTNKQDVTKSFDDILNLMDEANERYDKLKDKLSKYKTNPDKEGNQYGLFDNQLEQLKINMQAMSEKALDGLFSPDDFKKNLQATFQNFLGGEDNLTPPSCYP